MPPNSNNNFNGITKENQHSEVESFIKEIRVENLISL